MNKILKSFLFAIKGLTYAYKTQLNFKIHCFFIVAIVLLGVYVKISNKEWLWISLAITLVLILELLNTAL